MLTAMIYIWFSTKIGMTGAMDMGPYMKDEETLHAMPHAGTQPYLITPVVACGRSERGVMTELSALAPHEDGNSG